MTRTAQSSICVLFCDDDLDSCLEANEKRPKGKNKYDPELLKDLYSRMEIPNPKNRWDSPLYTLFPHEPIPFEAIHGSLFKDKKKMKANVSTKTEVSLGEDYVYKVDKVLNGLIKDIHKQLCQNRQFLNQKKVRIIRGKTAVDIAGKVTIGQLKSAKNEFSKLNKINPILVMEEIPQAFLYFLESRN